MYSQLTDMYVVRAVQLAGCCHICWLSLWCHWMSSAGFQCAPSGTQRWHRQCIFCSSTTTQKPFVCATFPASGFESVAEHPLRYSSSVLLYLKELFGSRKTGKVVLRLCIGVLERAPFFFHWSHARVFALVFLWLFFIYFFCSSYRIFSCLDRYLLKLSGQFTHPGRCRQRSTTMESGVVHIYKEDRCPSGQPEECIPNFTWQPGLSDAFNYTPNGTWDAEPEPMSPIIPIIVAVYSVVFVVGLAGNCLVMYVIIRWVFSFEIWQLIPTCVNNKASRVV